LDSLFLRNQFLETKRPLNRTIFPFIYKKLDFYFLKTPLVVPPELKLVFFLMMFCLFVFSKIKGEIDMSLQIEKCIYFFRNHLKTVFKKLQWIQTNHELIEDISWAHNMHKSWQSLQKNPSKITHVLSIILHMCIKIQVQIPSNEGAVKKIKFLTDINS
jgi:hypothetical protein